MTSIEFDAKVYAQFYLSVLVREMLFKLHYTSFILIMILFVNFEDQFTYRMRFPSFLLMSLDYKLSGKNLDDGFLDIVVSTSFALYLSVIGLHDFFGFLQVLSLFHP